MGFRRRWIRHELTDSSAAIAFYSLLSMVPLLLIGVVVASLVLGERAAQGELAKQLESVLGPGPATFFESIVKSSQIFSRGASLPSVAAFISLLFAGSHAFAKLRGTLNTINGVTARDAARPVLGRLLARGLAILLILLFGGLLVVGTLAQGIVERFARELSSPFVAEWQLLRGYDRLSSYLLLSVAFVVVMMLLPRRRPLWRHACIGALLTAVIVGSLKWGLQFYIVRSPIASAFGAGMTALVFFLWLLLSIQAFLAGALVAAMLSETRTRRYGWAGESCGG